MKQSLLAARGACAAVGSALLLAEADTTITLKNGLNGYSGTTDAWLEELSSGDDNHGGSQRFRLRWNGSYSGDPYGHSDTTVLRFDLTGRIPTGQSIVSATLRCYYVTEGSMQSDNALTVKPFRIATGKSWYENIYEDADGVGVNWKWRDQAQTLPWSIDPYYGQGGWGDRVDDGNSTVKLKPTGGSVPGAIEPGNWLACTVTSSVRSWYTGSENNGFLLGFTAFEGGGNDAYADLASSEDSLSGWRPELLITYRPVPEPSGAAVAGVLCGVFGWWFRCRKGR
jgi:hypothetical protein